MTQELIFHIWLNQIKGVGHVNTKKIVAFCGDLEAVFKEKQLNLEKISNIGPVLASQIKNSSVFSRADEDGIDDTPNAAQYGQNQCNHNINSCTDSPYDFPDMVENYMDYSDPSCQNIFTKG